MVSSEELHMSSTWVERMFFPTFVLLSMCRKRGSMTSSQIADALERMGFHMDENEVREFIRIKASRGILVQTAPDTYTVGRRGEALLSEYLGLISGFLHVSEEQAALPLDIFRRKETSGVSRMPDTGVPERKNGASGESGGTGREGKKASRKNTEERKESERVHFS